MTLRTSPHAFRRASHALALGAALACAVPAFAAPSPADVTNPDGSVSGGSLSGRYEAFAGAEFPVDPNGLAVRLTAGIHATANFTGSHGSEHATSFPFEATLWYPVNDTLRLGGGVRYAMRTRFSGAGNHTADNLNPTPSLVFGAGYRLLPHLLLDLRYVYQRYEQPNGDDLDASHWGVGLTAIY